MNFLLSSKSLKQIKDAGVEDNFEFQMFGEIFRCNLFVALFISKNVSKEYSADPTTRNFTIEFPPNSLFYKNQDELKAKIEYTKFNSIFKNILDGDPIHFDVLNAHESSIQDESKLKNIYDEQSQEKAKILFEIGKIIDNDEMIEFSLEILGYSNNKEELTIQKSFQMLKIMKELGYPKLVENIHEIIASKFYSLFQSKEEKNENNEIIEELKKMNKYDLEQILSSKNLQILSEDWLFELINSLGSEYFFLYDYVEIQYLSVENIKKLISNVENYEIPLHSLLWSSICRRLMIDVSGLIKLNNPFKHVTPVIKCDDGIFKYLQKASSDNVFVSKTIDVETSKIDAGEVKNLFDHSKSTDLRVEDSNNSFIIIDFKDKKVNLTKYYFSVPTGTGRGNNRPKTWEIEASDDKTNWKVINKIENDSSLSSEGKSSIFSIQHNNNEFYRYIRIKEIIGEHGGHQLLLSEIEFYGSII